MRIRNSIAIPIVLVLLSIAFGIIVVGYFINKGVFLDVFEEAESEKSLKLHRAVDSLITGEVARINGFAKLLGKDTDVHYALYHHGVTKGDLKPLMTVMDQLASITNLQIFAVADPGGKILYGAGKSPAEGGAGSIAGFERALRGEDVFTVSRASDGWGLRRLVPVYALERNRPAGIMILGTRIDDGFARKIASETGSHIFLVTSDGVVAGSYPLRESRSIDLAQVGTVLAGAGSVFVPDERNLRSLTYVPLNLADAKFCLVVETDISVVDALLRGNRIKMAQLGLYLFAGIALLGAALTHTLVRPLDALQQEARQIIREYSGKELRPDPRQNEISTLVRAIHLMVETIKDHIAHRNRAEEQLRQAQKMEALGRLAGGIAHDFNTQLSVIILYSDLLRKRLDRDGTGRREVVEIQKAGERAAGLTRQLLAFSRRQVLRPRLLALDEVVSNLGEMLQRLIGNDFETVIDLPPGLWTIEADPNQIELIIMNLVVNARDAMPGGGKLAITAANVSPGALPAGGEEAEAVPAGEYVALEVADTGIGMAPETLSRVFEPFFTTKEVGKGTGLGLATVYGIVKQSGGHIRVRSAPGSGTTFTIFFPRAERMGGGAERVTPPEGRSLDAGDRPSA